MIQRRIFVDHSLRASSNYSKEALCWYDMEIQETRLSEEEVGTKTINHWAVEQNERALEVFRFRPLLHFSVFPCPLRKKTGMPFA